MMSDKQLEELGVKAMGDRLRIRAFCERKSKTTVEQKKRQDAVDKLKSMLGHQRASKGVTGANRSRKRKRKWPKQLLNSNLVGSTGVQELKHLDKRKREAEAEPGL
ncbi:unnamed protein product [Porites lobata]|uniref:SAM domain-containing protein n=1 Tax=Porites lobata TaxID=104759 RepID=A0ABN8RQA6_9CNID|nr:unnamed protein product [Porites lobata]